MSCVEQISICVTRGDTFRIDVGLSSSWQEIIDSPFDYEANLVFREAQDDTLPDLLTLTSTPEIVASPVPGELPIYFAFMADTLQTESLPQWDIVAYCELVKAGASGEVTRLFNASVNIGD